MYRSHLLTHSTFRAHQDEVSVGAAAAGITGASCDHQSKCFFFPRILELHFRSSPYLVCLGLKSGVFIVPSSGFSGISLWPLLCPLFPLRPPSDNCLRTERANSGCPQQRSRNQGLGSVCLAAGWAEGGPGYGSICICGTEPAPWSLPLRVWEMLPTQRSVKPLPFSGKHISCSPCESRA